MASSLEVQLPPLHPGQVAVAAAGARFKVLAAGRRWGKTSLGVTLGLRTALERGRAWWVAPTYPLASIGWKVARHLARQIPNAEAHESERLIEFPGRGEFQVKSADNPGSLRGAGLDGVVVDEAAYVKEEAWTEALRPALSDRRGWALFISTPNGYNWFHALFEAAATLEGWARWQRPTWDNPRIDAAEIKAARAQAADVIFRQEYGAEFIDIAGLKPFVRDWIEYWGEGGLVEVLPDGLLVEAGIDPAISERDTADMSAINVAGQARSGPNRGTIFNLENIAGHWSAYEQADRLLKAARRWKIRTVRIEDVAYQRSLGEILNYRARETGIALGIELIRPETDKLRRAHGWSGLVQSAMVLFGPGQAELIAAMLAVPQDKTKWHRVDAAGLCIRGFNLLQGKSERLEGFENSTPRLAEATPRAAR
jgi:predicted phage terminase large subunit-like protein